MDISLNQLIRDQLELLTKQQQSNGYFEEFIGLSAQGHSACWIFDRDELHEKT